MVYFTHSLSKYIEPALHSDAANVNINCTLKLQLKKKAAIESGPN